MPITPNMNLDLPTPESTVGPDWAEALNTALTAVDSHDHSDNNGTKVTQAGIEFTDTVDVNQQALDNVKQVNLSAQASVVGTGILYRVGSNLWFNNGAGVAIQLTSGSSVNASGTGTISLDTPGAYPYDVDSGDAQKVLGVDTSSAKTVNLPAATTSMFFMIKDITGSAQSNNISVVPDGTDTIDGSNTTMALGTNYGSWGFVSDGVSAWYVV